MSRLLIRPVSYRHVVFPDRRTGRDLAVNFSPAAAPASPPSQSAEDPLSADEHDCIQWLFRRAGLSSDDYRPETIKRRIPACLRAARVSSLTAVPSAVQGQPELLKLAMGALVIGVTAFFRDSQVFEAIQAQVIPELLSRPAGPRVWSAGCSDGLELYSVAILLAERGGLQRCSLLGTDCRIDALDRARDGRYDDHALKSVPAHFRNRYFQLEGVDWRIHPYLRSVAKWRSGNMLTTVEPGGWDLVLCRNMVIYMLPAAAARIWHALADCLRPGGYLILGKAERPHGAVGLKAVAPCIYRRDRS